MSSRNRSHDENMNRGWSLTSAFGMKLKLFFSINNCQLSMYADDHQLYSSGAQISVVETILNDQAQVAANWYSDNFLSANKEKFQAIVIRNREKDISKICLKVDNEEIEQTTLLKLLGVNIDHQLSFSEHVKFSSVKSSQKIGVPLRLKNFIPEKAKLHIFKTSILPHLTYCSLVWHFIRSSDKRKLKR